MVTYDDLPFGFSWFPDEALTRTSHAIDTGDGVWLVDPVDVGEALERAVAVGSPVGVLQLLDRHNRDCAAIAARLGVPRLRLPAAIPGSPFAVVPVLKLPRWHEIALWWPERRVLVVAELIGTNPVYAVGAAAAGLHPMLRISPPGALRGYEPEHLLVGHGPGVHGAAAAEALAGAYAGARRDLPRLLGRLPAMARAAVATRRPT
ncbi:MAG TPA: hypothetical protein VKA57_02300 [Solirubrobacteraceae bacterium]|nr:hypothetical protein [Solirubrobacteraceae bacterium]